MAELKYPKYTREQNLGYKLTKKDIKNIRLKYSQGDVTMKELGEKYSVSGVAVCYWVNESCRQRQLLDNCSRQYHLRDYATYRKNKRNKFEHRKRKIEQYRLYERLVNKKSYTNNRDAILSKARAYYKKNRAAILQKQKERDKVRRNEEVICPTLNTI